MFTREKLRETSKRISKISAYSFEHGLFLGGLAGIAYGAYQIYHPLGPILGGWFAVKVAMLISSERN